MARNDVDFNAVFTFLQNDGVTPLYLTTDGISGGTKLSMTMALAPYPIGDVLLEFSTEEEIDGTLAILDAPNDNQIYWNVPDGNMSLLVPRTYICEFISPPSGPPRLGFGAFKFCVTPGITPEVE